MKVALINRIDPANVGDTYANPQLYFPWLAEASRFDINGDIPEGFDWYIFGGGGLIHELWEEKIRLHLGQHGSRTVLWSIGTNYHGEGHGRWPDWLGLAALAGIRDPESGYLLSPCPSCLLPEFDRLRPLERSGVCAFSHRSIPIEIPGVPVRFNDELNVAAVLRFIAGHALLITNSYHGAMWGSWLGRSVIVFRPWSTKFHCLDSSCVLADDALSMPLEIAKPNRYLLASARKSTLRFAEQVKRLIYG